MRILQGGKHMMATYRLYMIITLMMQKKTEAWACSSQVKSQHPRQLIIHVEGNTF